MTAVALKHVYKKFGVHTVCDDVNLEIAEGEFITLLGSSGCGKTTTLNMVAGLEDASSGDILMRGERVNDLSPVQRDVAMVFQNFALYPHMTVAQNIGFTLKMRKLGAEEIRARVARVAAALELGALLERLPSQLSGGQQQRVAIGRALVREPRVFLFDEPFSNLDASLRVKMRGEVKELHQRLGVTSIFVTHDQEEAMSISDRIAIMHAGRIEQIGTPEDIYERPATRYVASFIGNPQIDLVPARVAFGSGGPSAAMEGMSVRLPDDPARFVEGREIAWGIRPEHVRLVDSGVPGTVRLVQPVGPATHVTVDWAGGTLVASTPGFVRLPVGSPVQVELPPERLLVFDRESGRRL
ncbi:MAG: ABC transporter ATP-binding protein [Rhizobiales bacterium]|nr:ABC transporter ATP-binding protein [Hyphomicrobiales bacterium]